MAAAPRDGLGETSEKEKPLGGQDFKPCLWLSALSRWTQKSRNADLHVLVGWLVWLDAQECKWKIGNKKTCEGEAAAGPVTGGTEREGVCILCGYPRQDSL